VSADHKKDLLRLLGDMPLAGTEQQLEVLYQRIQGLVQLNGEHWVQRHREQLRDEWERLLQMGYPVED
jgi:hypothetical protein